MISDKEWLYNHPGKTLADRPKPDLKPPPIGPVPTNQEMIHRLEKYIGDLTFKAPEVFPSGLIVHYEVGKILGMWV
jgi:hypothetical protein